MRSVIKGMELVLDT